MVLVLSLSIQTLKCWIEGSNINPNIVLGVKTAQRFGFKKWQDAVRSNLNGYDFWMQNVTLPRQGDVWCIEPDSKLAGQTLPPLEYYLEIDKGYLELYKKQGFFSSLPAQCRTCQTNSTDCMMTPLRYQRVKCEGNIFIS